MKQGGVATGVDGSSMGIRIGMEVYGLLMGADGYFTGKGIVTGMEGGILLVGYSFLPHSIRYRQCDIGKSIFMEKGEAEYAAEMMGDEKREAEREDFAEQNNKAFGKI